MQDQKMYGYKCECCGGIVEKRLIDKEVFNALELDKEKL